MKKKEITIEKLAQMIQKGFLDAQEDRAGMRQDVSRIKEDIKDIRNKLSSLERRVIFLEDKATEHSKQLKELKNLIQKFQKERQIDREKIIWLEKRVARLEAEVGIC